MADPPLSLSHDEQAMLAQIYVTDDNCGAMTLLIARNAATQARAGLVRRLLDPKRN